MTESGLAILMILPALLDVGAGSSVEDHAEFSSESVVVVATKLVKRQLSVLKSI